MNHTEIRLILKPNVEIPEDVKRENDILGWADYVQIAAMRTVAAGVLVSTGSLEKAASVLSWSGFTVPDGYFPDGHPACDYFGYEEEKLRAWVEADEEKIRGVIGKEVFRLAATGSLLTPSEDPDNLSARTFEETMPELAPEDEEKLGEIHEEDVARQHEDEDFVRRWS